MALIFIEGFDVYNSSTQLSPGKWDILAGGPTFTTGRLGVNKCILLNSYGDYVEKIVNNIGPFVIGMAIKLSGSPAAETILEFYEGGVANLKLQVNTARKLEATNTAGTIVGTSTLALSVGVWYYVELKAAIGNTGSIEVKIDSNTEINATSVDTMNSANAYIDNIRLRGNTAIISVDDFYILDITTALNNNFLADSRIDPFFPTSDNSVQWTPSSGGFNYADVDETIPDGDTTYVYSATPGNIDLYNFQDMPVGTGSVFGVQVVANARKMDAGTRSLKLKVKSGATTQTSVSKTLSTTYLNTAVMFQDSDGAGTAWTKTLVDAAQIGIEVV